MAARTFNARPKAGEPSEDWLTPPGIIAELARELGGEFDLDPACPPAMPWRTARRMICRPEDGLSADWGGGNVRVWLNPPYGRASATLFLRGRVRFCRPDGREEQAAPAPSALVAYGGACAAALRRAAKKLDGAFVELEKKS